MDIIEEEKEIEIDGVKYKIPNPNILKDYLTDEYFIKDQEHNNFITITKDLFLERKNTSSKSFNFVDESTKCIYSEVYDVVHITSLPRLIDCSIKVVISSINDFHYINIHTSDKDKFIKKHNLVLGIYNTDTYFFKRELKIMDKKKPYRKFDNVYYKQTSKEMLVNKVDNKIETVNTLSKNILLRNLTMGVDSLTHLILENKRYTFGIELETCEGRLESEDVTDLNIKAVHDGSLRDADGNTPGGEYVTGILYGDSGFKQLNEICKTLSNKCKINNQCGVHVHIGNMNWNKEDVVYSYILAELLENSIFNILPKSRRSNNYCRRLTPLLLDKTTYLFSSPSNSDYLAKIDEFYNLIHKEVSGLNTNDGPTDKINKNTNHPKGSKCGYDKLSQRYCWLNYVTLLFNTKEINDSHTLEFRNHGATLNFTKIKNWVKICIAFVHFVENFKNIIKSGKFIDKDGKTYSLDLELIIVMSYPKTARPLIEYIRERKELFKLSSESVDYVEEKKAVSKSIKEILCV